MSSPEFQTFVIAEMEAITRAADACPFLSDSHSELIMDADRDVKSSDDEAPPRTPLAPTQRSFRTPGSAAAAIISSPSGSKYSDYDDSGDDSDGSDGRPSLLLLASLRLRLWSMRKNYRRVKVPNS